MNEYKSLKIIKSLFKPLKNYTTLFFIVGIIGTVLLLYYGEKIPNIIIIAQFWTIITVYIVLVIQFKSEKEKSQKEKGIAISQIEYLLYYIFENIDKKTLTELQNETKKIIGNLRRFYSAILTKIHCFFTEPTNITIYFEKNLILINPVDIIKWEKNKAINITKNREEIDLIIDNLRESV